MAFQKMTRQPVEHPAFGDQPSRAAEILVVANTLTSLIAFERVEIKVAHSAWKRGYHSTDSRHPRSLFANKAKLFFSLSAINLHVSASNRTSPLCVLRLGKTDRAVSLASARRDRSGG